MSLKVLLIDNYDSYTHILANYIWLACGEKPLIVKNDDHSLEEIEDFNFDCIVISPGPGHPANKKDVGICGEIIDHFENTPILGICMGHQLLGVLNGAGISKLDYPTHGVVSKIQLIKDKIFSGISEEFNAMRYHSLVIDSKSDLSNLEILGKSSDDDQIMALKVKGKPHYGFQFHPESVGTEQGQMLINNFISFARESVSRGRKKRLSLFAEPHKLKISSEELFEASFKNSKYAFWLDSNSSESFEKNQVSVMGEPDQLICFKDNSAYVYNVKDDRKTLISEIHDVDPFEFIKTELQEYNIQVQDNYSFDFAGGLIAAFTYESKKYAGFGNDRQKKNKSLLGYDIVLYHVSSFVLVDQAKDQYWTAGVKQDRKEFEDFKNEIESRISLHRVSQFYSERNSHNQETYYDVTASKWSDSKGRYVEKINEIIQLLKQGETYEVCLTNMFTMNAEMDAFVLYKDLRKKNPTSYSAYFRFGEYKILSSSPEKFISLSLDGKIASEPMKGTRKRGSTDAEDEAIILEMINSKKDESELSMITDLLRNDIAKVSSKGGVIVKEKRYFRKYATVIQQSSVIESELDKMYDGVDLFRSVFPGGSVTGAPKHRTCDIIDKLEDFERGIYTGSIGYFSYLGSLNFNICIRTIEMNEKILRYGAGGAIVIDSDPEDEYGEILIKSKAVLDLLRIQKLNTVKKTIGNKKIHV